jgi:hypothetical protein
MKRFFFLLLIFISTHTIAQQFAFQLWHEGKMVLDSGDTLRGKIKYDLQTDLIQIQESNRNESFTARKVVFFEIFDQTVKSYRQFYSLPYTTSGQYKAPIFFELLEEGKITLLAREAVEYKTYSSPYYFYGGYTRLVLVNKYFLLQENGEIKEFNDKKGDWYDLMGNKAEDVHRYAKTNHLDFNDKIELSKIIAYYNSLFIN